jgi:hypothetical protein
MSFWANSTLLSFGHKSNKDAPMTNPPPGSSSALPVSANARNQSEALKEVFSHLWRFYRGLVPEVGIIEDSLRAHGEVWSEDHVAFRTFPGPFCGAAVLQSLFELLGYQRKDAFIFEEKKLNAFWMQPPQTADTHSTLVAPKIFISEWEPQTFPSEVQEIVAKHTSQVCESPVRLAKQYAEQNRWQDLVLLLVGYLTLGTPWAPPTSAEYELLRKHSEYAAWTLAFGPQANHFTVGVHLMKNQKNFAAFNEHIQNHLKITMNTSGGLIKGGMSFRLEQSSTLAAPRLVAFQDGARIIPYAFVEFAFRYPLEGKADDGFWESYYQGFVASNADKIFESTDVRKS